MLSLPFCPEYFISWVNRWWQRGVSTLMNIDKTVGCIATPGRKALGRGQGHRCGAVSAGWSGKLLLVVSKADLHLSTVEHCDGGRTRRRDCNLDDLVCCFWPSPAGRSRVIRQRQACSEGMQVHLNLELGYCELCGLLLRGRIVVGVEVIDSQCSSRR